MKSTKGTKKFTFEDFEKGLMLAGYILPASASEVDEKEALEKYEQEYEKKNNHTRSKNYFKRAVLAAEIANQLHAENTFGHVKFQKMVFLCEKVSHLDFNSNYLKKAAGPFDNKFMHTIDREFEKQKWFTVEKINERGFLKYKYTPHTHLENYKQYFNSYYGEITAEIQFIIDIFRKQNTRFVELVATIFACMLELLEKDETLTFDTIKPLFYDWADEKKKFNQSEVKSAINWMYSNNLYPSNA